MPNIAIVNDQDEIVGTAETHFARKTGLIHRIIRVIAVNDQGEILLQKRNELVNSPGKWDHSVTGHVDANEDYYQAAHREAQEEMSFRALHLEPLVKFFRSVDKNGEQLRQFNMIFLARTNEAAQPNPEEIAEIRWLTLTEFDEWIAARPQDFTNTTVLSHPKISGPLRKLLHNAARP